jgi:hypothetical protein
MYFFFQGELIASVIIRINDRDLFLSTRRSYCRHFVLRKYVQNECSFTFVARNTVTTVTTYKCHDVWKPATFNKTWHSTAEIKTY